MRLVLTIALAVVPSIAQASSDASPCTAAAQAQDSCWVAVDQLLPTQLTYGAFEVQRRAADIAAKSPSQQTTYLENHPVTLLVGPGGLYYVTDGHHVALAFAAVAGNSAAVFANVQDNWSTLSVDAFWSKMQAAGLVYLYDANGAGPLPLSALPSSLFQLQDDPYRSLAWGVRKNGGYNDTTVPYADFLWANFFRSRITPAQVAADFDAAVTAATPFAHSPAASTLPGYIAPGAP